MGTNKKSQVTSTYSQLLESAMEDAKQTTLCTNFGFEYTFIKPSWFCDLDRNWSFNVMYRGLTEDAWKEKFKHELDLEPELNKFEYDYDCGNVMEIKTPPTNNFQTIIDDYKTILSVMTRLGWRTHDKIESGGGGHIHVDFLCSSNLYSRIELLNDVLLNINIMPFINWVFLEENDNISANNPFLDKSLNKKDFINWIRMHNACQKWIPNEHIDKKNRSIVYNSGPNTIEFRIFQTPRNVVELIVNVMWVNKFYSRCNDGSYIYIKDNNKWTSCFQLSSNQINNLWNNINKYKTNKSLAAKDFLSFTKIIFSRSSRYWVNQHDHPALPKYITYTLKQYIKRNLNKRFDVYGTKYLI